MAERNKDTLTGGGGQKARGTTSDDQQPAHAISAFLMGPAFGANRVLIARISGEERVGALFDFAIDVAAVDRAGFNSETATGAAAELSFVQNGSEVRRLSGIVCQVNEWLDNESGVPFYRLRFVPRAHLLTLVQTQQVYLDKTVVEIIDAKLSLADLPHRFDLHGVYPKREIVVQYAETDIAFIARLSEHVGISFYLVHDPNDGEVMVFTDAQRFFELPNPRRSVPFRSHGDNTDIYRLERETQLIPKVYVVSDYNYRTPLVELASMSRSQHSAGGGVIEYGTHFRTPTEGEALAAVRREEHECRRVVYRGVCDRPDIAAGCTFSLVDHPRFPDQDLLVIASRHEVRQTTHGHADTGSSYRNSFVAIDASVRFRPERLTPKPKIHGIVNALVLPQPGTDGTQPWLDDNGRYVVRLLFDTADAEGKASHTIRMAQAHAGPDIGIHFPLRPGVEVLLAFVHGDPDRPIIVGAVPNGVTPSPVLDKQALFHRIKTTTGVKIEIEDGF
jgi:type VI secretion system secreted protein VgrG